jgi:malonyl CoA-acyl carrier protein transacylase
MVALILKEAMEEAGKVLLKIALVEAGVGVRQPAGAAGHSLGVL